MSTFQIHTDGGARGNPGPAAIGVVIERDGVVQAELKRYIGETTNNQAEYQAVHAALTWVVEQQGTEVELFADSELIVKQLRGEYKVKNKDLAPWHSQCQQLMRRIGSVRLHVVRREQNAAADALVNQALDQRDAES